MLLQPAAKGDRILAVDDTPDNLFLIQTLLEGDGYQVSLAEDGEAALAQVEKSPPDLILLDVMMPRLDGYEVTRRIRQNQKLPFIPILLITAHRRSSVVEGLDAGADDFIRKPMDVDELLARVRALLRLKHSIDVQEQMARQREDFVSRLTHDLRTPLIAMDRMLSLMGDGAFGSISSELQEAITSMTHSNKNLIQMVNTILEVYRHDAGHKTLVFSPCNLQDLVQLVVHELAPLANERGIALTVNIVESTSSSRQGSGKSGLTVIGDSLELRRVLTNLIGNAIKFTEEGSVNIRLIEATRLDVEARSTQPTVTIEIQDTGVGIAPENQAMLFERFRHGTHRRSGSGLGLYLSHRIVEAHRGTIEVQSKPGQGSLFTIRLPAFQLALTEQNYQVTSA